MENGINTTNDNFEAAAAALGESIPYPTNTHAAYDPRVALHVPTQADCPSFRDKPTTEDVTRFERCCFVLDQGFVIWAEKAIRVGDMIQFINARGVRNWGTVGVGLGALAQGPKKETVLDQPFPMVWVSFKAVLFLFPTVGDWNSPAPS